MGVAGYVARCSENKTNWQWQWSR